jgi:XTP/dITP diphosphohydrolase
MTKQPRQLCLATNNKHKIIEFQSLLKEFRLVSLSAAGIDEEIPENEATIEGNSRAKAEYVYIKTGLDCLSDDSGLEVFELNMEPGVFSARYAGSHKSDSDNIELLLRNLIRVGDKSARFKCVITLCLNSEYFLFEGIIKGKIVSEKRGNNGFGYDPVFVPDGYDQTFAELSSEVKNQISHRARATKKLLQFLSTGK